MIAKQHKHKGYGYEIWPLGSNFSWAVVGVHEGDGPHIAGAKDIAATEHEAERDAKLHIDFWTASHEESAKALGSSFVGGVGTVTAHPPAGTVVQEDDGV